MNNYKIYRFVNTAPIKLLRVAFFVISALVFVLYIKDVRLLKQLLLPYFIFVTVEIYIQEKINKCLPHKVSDKTKPVDSILYPVRSILDSEKYTGQAIQRISKLSEIKYLMARLGTVSFPDQDVDRQELFQKAQELASSIGVSYINEIDIIAAFLLISESQTKFLSQHELSSQDILRLHAWLRNRAELTYTHKSSLPIDGVFDDLVTGWNVEIRKYASNLTNDVVSRKQPPELIGLKTQYQEFVEALSKSQENNVLLIGEVGVGKRNLVRRFAYDSYTHQFSGALDSRKVFELYIDRLLSGIKAQNELEERLEYLFSELAHTGEIIVYIENIENLFGGGGFGTDLGGVLTPYLESRSFTIIGTISREFYQKYIEPHESIKQFFSPVTIPQSSESETIDVMLSHVEMMESQYHEWVIYGAIPEAVKLSASYYPDRFLPSRALSLLEDTLSSAHNHKKKIVDRHDVRDVVSAKTNIVTEEPTKVEKELLLHLEDRMHEKLIDQEEAVSSIAKALRRLRSGFENKNRPIASFLFLGPTGVGKTETAKRLADLYFGSEHSMVRLDMSEFQTQDAIRKILGELPGEEIISEALVDQIREHPFSLLLLDEFEKAHSELLNLFLQILDEGHVTDNRGKSASFTNTIIIATSNAGSEFIRESQIADTGELKKQLLDSLLSLNKFKPELLNRFDDVVVFRSLSPEHAKQVARLMLADSLKKLTEDDITLEFDDSVLDRIVKDGYSQEFGARNLRRYIQDTIEDFVSRQILENKINRGDKKTLSIDQSGEFVIT